MREVRVRTLQWATGIYSVLIGTVMLLTPHQFNYMDWHFVQFNLPYVGFTFLIIGFALFSIASLALPRRWIIVIHLLAGALFAALAGNFAEYGARILAINLLLLGVALAASGFFDRAWARFDTPSNYDFFALLMAVTAVLTGLILLISPSVLETIIFHIDQTRVWIFGMAFLLAGLISLSGQIYTGSMMRTRSTEPLILRFSYLILAIVFVLFFVTATLPSRLWIALAYYGCFGLVLALLPWAKSVMMPFGPTMLRNRLALVLAFTAAIPLILATALLTNQQEQAVKADTMINSQKQAIALAQGVETYVDLHRQALKALVRQPNLARMPADEQQKQLQSYIDSFPALIFTTLYNVRGQPLISNTPDSAPTPGLSIFNEVARSLQPVLRIDHSPGIKRPTLDLGAPLTGTQGDFEGVVTFGLDLADIETFLEQQNNPNNSLVYLVDNQGRVIAHPDQNLMISFANLSTLPPVLAALSGSAVGYLDYQTGSGEKLAGFAEAPALGWNVIVERNASDALAEIYRERELTVAILILVLFITTAGGLILASLLTSPLNSLASAAEELADGNNAAPLPISKVAEIEYLARIFGEMRDRLAARTAEREAAIKALEEQRVLFENVVRQAADAIVVCNSQGELIFVNEAAWHMARLSPQDANLQPAMDIWSKAYTVDNLPIPQEESLLSLALHGEPIIGREARMQRSDGSHFDILASAAPLIRNDGSRMGAAAIFADITEKKQVEEELRQIKAELEERVHLRTAELSRANQQLNAILKALPVGVWIANAKGKTVRKNEMADRIWGGDKPLSPGNPDDREYKGVWTDTRQDLNPEDWAMARAAARGETIIGQVIDIQRFDGTIATIYNSAAPILDQFGKVIGAVATSQDITLQRRLEEQAHLAKLEALQRSQELKAVIQSVTDAILVYDADGRVIQANPAAITLCGYNPLYTTPQEGLDRIGLFYPDGKPYPLEETASSRALKRETVRDIHFKLTNAQGHRYDILSSAAPLFVNDQPQGAVVIWHDISDLVRAQQALHASEQKLRSLVESSPDGIVLVDESGVIIEWNLAQEKITGVKREAALGEYLWEIQYLIAIAEEQQPAAVERAKATILGLLSSGQAAWINKPLQRKIIRPDSSGCTLQSLTFPIQTEKAWMAGSFSRDITEQVQIEEARQRLVDILEATPDLVSTSAMDGQVLYFNKAAREALGINIPNSPPGLYISQCYPAWVNDLFTREAIPTALQTGFWNGEAAFLNQHGEEVPVSQVLIAHCSPGGNATYLSSISRDIRERKQTEAALQLSEKEYRAMFEVSGVGKARVDPATGRFIRVNHKLCEITGYSDAELLTMTFSDITYPDDREQDRVLYQSVLFGETKEWTSEKRYIRKDGSMIWVEVVGNLDRNLEGEPISSVAVIQDITSRKQAELALLKSETRERRRAEEIEAIMDAVPAIVWIAQDPQASHVTGNRAAAQLLRMEPTQNQSKTAYPDPVPAHFKVMKDGIEIAPHDLPLQVAAAQGVEIRDFEEQIVFEDGTLRQLMGSVTPLLDEIGQPRGAVGAFIDITERVQAEQALKKTHEELELRVQERTHELQSANENLKLLLAGLSVAEEELRVQNENLNLAHDRLEVERKRYQDLFEFAPDGYLVTNAFGIIQQANQVAGAMLGIDPQRLIKKPLGLYITPEDRPALSSMLAQQSQQSTIADLEIRLQPRHRRPFDGALRVVSVSNSASQEVQDSDAELTMRWLVRDITESKGAALELQQAKQELEIRVAERTTELALANQNLHVELQERKRAEDTLKDYANELQRSNQELQDFAFIASHDLQEPLRKIQAFGERVRMRYAGILDEEGSDYLVRMGAAAERMQLMLNGLLAYSRVTTKAQPFVPVNLNLVTQEVLSDLEVRIERSGGSVEVDQLPSIYADPLQMRQLMLNLLSNALKFHRPDTPPVVKVSAKYQPEEDPSRGKIVQVSIEDNGIGFEEKYLDRIFQPFQRLVGRSQFEGSGIGLAICRKIIERHAGKITATSTPGQGTTFIITLPEKQ